jgi:hypothetical protein
MMSERSETSQYIPLTVETLPLNLLRDEWRAVRRRARFKLRRIWLET